MRLTFCNWCSDLPAGRIGPLREELRSGTDAGDAVVTLCHISEVLQFVVLVVGTSLDTELCALIEQHAPVTTQPACVTDDSDSGANTHYGSYYMELQVDDRKQSVRRTHDICHVMNHRHEPRV